MATLEMVEKLRQRANVSYDEAKAALEACGDDLLEAMIYLEKQGKTTPPTGGYYTTQNQYSEQQTGAGWQAPPEKHGESFGQVMARFGRWLAALIEKGNAHTFEVRRQEKKVISLPLTAMVVLTIFCFPFMIIALITGLCMGCRYKVYGPELRDDNRINEVMETASKTADEIKSEIMKKHEDHQQYWENQQK